MNNKNIKCKNKKNEKNEKKEKNKNIKNKKDELKEFINRNEEVKKKEFNDLLLENRHILIINNGSFNPLIYHRNIIKKYNLQITLHNENNIYESSLKNDILNEENESNIKILSLNPFLIHEISNNILYDYIIIHHSSIYDTKLIILLKKIYHILKKDGKIYLYHSISNQNENKINKKNFIRTQIKKITKLPIGKIKNLVDINSDILNLNDYYIKIDSSLINKSKYLFFGENNLYLFILQKI